MNVGARAPTADRALTRHYTPGPPPSLEWMTVRNSRFHNGERWCESPDSGHPDAAVVAPNSVSAYARDVTLFCRLLHTSRGGKTIWECDGGDLRAYKSVRLHTAG